MYIFALKLPRESSLGFIAAQICENCGPTSGFLGLVFKQKQKKNYNLDILGFIEVRLHNIQILLSLYTYFSLLPTKQRW